MRGEGTKKEETELAKKFEEMTDEEKQQAFQKWLSGRESRKGQSQARRKAMQELIKLHAPEYARLLKAAGGTAPTAKAG